MKRIPLLFYGDSPELPTGLGRIGRDLASLAATMPEFRVGYLGRGGLGSRQLPFAQYNFDERWQWGEDMLEQAVKDFFGSERGVVMTIWDPTRLLWFARPDGMPCEKLLANPPFLWWGYFPIDSVSASPVPSIVLKTCRRPVLYSEWASRLMGLDWIPHGINTDIFEPRGRMAGRMKLGFSERDWVVGMVATNQARKDWGTAFQVFKKLAAESAAARFWIHTDVMMRSFGWDLHALIEGFGLRDVVKVTFSGTVNDTELSYLYSSCDATILATLGEGFGYPIAESLACGVPCVTTGYGGGTELVPEPWRCYPKLLRIDGLHNSYRPVVDAEQFAERLGEIRLSPPAKTECRALVEHLDWKRLWPACWLKWFEEGYRQCLS